MGIGRGKQPLLIVWRQAARALRLRVAVEANDVDAVSLERRVVAIALGDGPVEEVADARLEAVERDLTAFGAPTSERRGAPELERDRDLLIVDRAAFAASSRLSSSAAARAAATAATRLAKTTSRSARVIAAIG